MAAEPGSIESGSTGNLDSGTPDSDRVDRDVTRDQQVEGNVQDGEDAGAMLTDDDPQPNAAAGLGGGYREDDEVRDIGDLGTQGIDQG